MNDAGVTGTLLEGKHLAALPALLRVPAYLHGVDWCTGRCSGWFRPFACPLAWTAAAVYVCACWCTVTAPALLSACVAHVYLVAYLLLQLCTGMLCDDTSSPHLYICAPGFCASAAHTQEWGALTAIVQLPQR